jgi:hypothetical protein
MRIFDEVTHLLLEVVTLSCRHILAVVEGFFPALGASVVFAFI